MVQKFQVNYITNSNLFGCNFIYIVEQLIGNYYVISRLLLNRLYLDFYIEFN